MACLFKESSFDWFYAFTDRRVSEYIKMKDILLSDNSAEHQYARSSSSTPLVAKKTSDHGYAKSTASSTKKLKKLGVTDPKQRKLSFAKVPSFHKVTYVSSDSDEPLSSMKSTENSTLGGKSEKGSHPVNGLEQKVAIKIPVKKVSTSLPTEVSVLPPTNLSTLMDGRNLSPKAKKVPTLIKSPGFSKKAGKTKEIILEDQKEKKKKLSNGKKLISLKDGPSSLKKKQSPDSGRKQKKELISLSSDSDSDLDVPLSKLKASPKSNSKQQQVKNSKSKKSLSMTERSPKVKISHSKSPKSKDKVRIICHSRFL